MKMNSLPSRIVGVMAALGVMCVVLGIVDFYTIRKNERIGRLYANAYSALVLTQVRLNYYVELVDVKNQDLARFESAQGNLAAAMANCKDRCFPVGPSFCDSLLHNYPALADSEVPASYRVHEAVCSGL